MAALAAKNLGLPLHVELDAGCCITELNTLLDNNFEVAVAV